MSQPAIEQVRGHTGEPGVGLTWAVLSLVILAETVTDQGRVSGEVGKEEIELEDDPSSSSNR